VAAEVLQEHGHPAERPVGQVTGRLRARGVEAVAHHGVQLRVQPLDAVDRRVHEFLRARLPGADQL
jgi:hypothetical protein